MRLRLEVRRHDLPPVKVLWNTAGLRPGLGGASHRTSAAQLLEQVNEIIPLELGPCGLDDYVVEAHGYECLHFSILEQMIEEDAPVTIHPLELSDRRSRRASGRHQISHDGRHLIDGVAFGRPFLRANGQQTLINEDAAPEHQYGPRLLLQAQEGKEEDDDEDGDYQASETSEEITAIENGEPDELFLPQALAGRKRKRTRSQGLGIGNAGLSSALSSTQSTPNDGLYIPKKRSKQNLNTLLQTSRHSSRSSNRSVRFTTGYQETPATLRMGYDESIEGNSLSDTQTTSSGSNKENRLPAKTGTSGTLDNTSEDDIDYADVSVDSDFDGTTDEETSDDSSASGTSSTSSDSDSSGLDSDNSNSEAIRHHGRGHMIREKNSIMASQVSKQEPEKTRRGLDVTAKEHHGDDYESTSFPSVKPLVPPGEGNRRTQLRNERRRLHTRLKKLQDAGILSKTSTIQDCREWCKNLNGETFTAHIDKALEAKRQALLASIATGGVDVALEDQLSTVTKGKPVEDDRPDSTAGDAPAAQPASFAEGSPLQPHSLSGMSPVHETISHTTSTPSTNINESKALNSQGATNVKEPSHKAMDDTPNNSNYTTLTNVRTSRGRTQLDVAASRRLLFGSLGLKAPRSKDEENKLRDKLKENVKSVARKQVEETQASGTAEMKESDESWREKINLSAVECCGQRTRLSTPPFPFVQRWHGIYRRRSYKSSYEPGYHAQNSNVKTKHMEDPSTGTVNEQALEDHSCIGEVNDDGQDLPTVPEDLSSCPSLNFENAKPGTIVAFKQMEMSKATNWSPMISELRTAEITEVRNELLLLRLAKRDRPLSDKEFDPYTGQRVYSGFEAPDDDEDEEGIADVGTVEVTLEQMIEPIVIAQLGNPSFSSNGAKDESLDQVTGGRGADQEKRIPKIIESLPAADMCAGFDLLENQLGAEATHVQD